MKPAQSANFPEFEAEMLKIWAEEKTFERSLEQRKAGQRFSFYDGPPFANGLPHYGHVVTLAQKDAITRYKTMQGYYVPRRNGWDTHGLPVEYEVEKELGISGKRQIVELGVDKFNQAARDSVFKYKEDWQRFMTRLGRWADFEHDYATLGDDYIESVWWVFSELWKKDLVYQGFRAGPYCPRCATPLSNFEVNQNYKDDTPDPSVYVKFELGGHEPKKSLLVWTTTPWTLPANAALAVSAEADYVEVELLKDGEAWQKGERLILAKERLSVLDLKQAEYRVTNTVKGCEVETMMGYYEPLYQSEGLSEAEQAAAYRVYVDDSVSLEDGTGILHVAPRYGETDLALGQRVGLPLIESVDGNGIQTTGPEAALGLFFKEADRHIIADLTEKGRIFSAETFTHTYPFCWRCETPLMYFAMPSWFIAVTQLRDRLVRNNQEIHWVPEHIKVGRFGNWLAEARDWNVSRNRFWGAPLPIWVNEADNEDRIVVGSLAELRELSDTQEFDLHRPGIDNVVIKRDGKTYRRTEEVFDCWFESGAMPYAQDHYPFEHKEGFEASFPADFIAEGLDQTRGWFYTLHVLATALFDRPAFKNVVVNGLVLAADGKKLSKRLRNYPDPEEIFGQYGADSLRFFLLSSPVVSGEDVRFSADAVAEVMRNVFMTTWNVYSFLATYADTADLNTKIVQPESSHLLDQWLLARLNDTIVEVTTGAEAYEIARAVRPLREFVDDLSNWYLRRSRRRLSRSDDAADKREATATLHYVLIRTCQLLAPWSPFFADKLYRELTTGMDMPPSVHLADWPESQALGTEYGLALNEMESVRRIVTEGLAQRAQAAIKIRQPLAAIKVSGEVNLTPEGVALVAEEVNVKTVEVPAREPGDGVHWVNDAKIELDMTLTPELEAEGVARDLVRLIQTVRKEADLKVDDRIELTVGLVDGAPKVAAALEVHRDLIVAETLANSLVVPADKGEMIPKRVGGEEITITVRKVG